MRGRHTGTLSALSVLAVAATAVVAGQTVAAQPGVAADAPRAAAAASGRPAVTLPTGDRVLLTGDGAIMIRPVAAGRTSASTGWACPAPTASSSRCMS